MLSYQAPGATVFSTHITLKFPIQISSEGGVPLIPGRETDHALAGMEQLFAPSEARQSQNEMAMESQIYEGVAIPMTRMGERGQAVLAAGGLPPDYNANAFVGRVRGPTTYTVGIYV